MFVQLFPKCCGAGVLINEHLTGKGEAADMELIKQWVYYARRNGYRMYDFTEDYDGKPHGTRGPSDCVTVIGGKGDRKEWSEHNSWGMLLAITNPGQVEVGKRLARFGFKALLTTHNPVYGPWAEAQKGGMHPITLWGIDLNPFTEEQLKPGSAYPYPELLENPFITMTGTLGKVAAAQSSKIEKAPEVQTFQPA